MQLTTSELTQKGKHLLGPRLYLGTFAIDRVPQVICHRGQPQQVHFIINTQTSNLPGQHWVAVSIDCLHHTAYIFDSFGQPPPTLLVKQLRSHVKRIYYNTRQVQAPNTQNCGQLALQHLLHIANLRGGARGLPYWKAFVH